MNFVNVFRRKPLWNIAPEGTPAAEGVAGVTPPVDPPAPQGSALSAAPAEPPATTPAPEEVVPLTAADLTLPAGAEGTDLAPFLEAINSADLSPKDRAQKLLDLHVAQQTAFNERATAEWNNMQTQWEKELKELPDIGGDNLPKSLASIKKACDAAGATAAFYQALDLTGAGSNPEIVKMFYNLTRHLQEGPPVLGAPPKGKLSQAERMFTGHTE